MAWLGVNAMDAALTLMLIGLGGIEGNPMLSYLQGEMGAVWMLSIKLAISAAVGLLLIVRGRAPMLRLASKLMAVVVVYNAVVAFYYFAPNATMPFVN
jgi:predicted MFS family arabinose efflux permease